MSPKRAAQEVANKLRDQAEAAALAGQRERATVLYQVAGAFGDMAKLIGLGSVEVGPGHLVRINWE